MSASPSDYPLCANRRHLLASVTRTVRTRGGTVVGMIGECPVCRRVVYQPVEPPVPGRGVLERSQDDGKDVGNRSEHGGARDGWAGESDMSGQ